MESVKISGKLTIEERETILNYDSVERAWVMDSTVPKHFRKALKQGWTPIKQYVYDDGMVCGMVLTAPERAITIRSTEKKQLSEKQLENLNTDDCE
jgi:hypothetical protein